MQSTLFGGDQVADNEEKTDVRKKIIEESLLLGSGLFDDETEVLTTAPVAQEAERTEEDTKGSRDDAMDAGFSVTIDDERAVSDIRKAQLEAKRYFLKPEPIPKNGEARTKEKLKMPEKPKVKETRPLNGVQQRPVVKSGKPQVRSHERSKMTLECYEDFKRARVKDKEPESKFAIRDMRSKPRTEEKSQKHDTAENKGPLPECANRSIAVKAKVKPDKLMSMDMGDKRPGMEMKSKMDMEMNIEQEGMAEYFRR